jgi:PST family polysaccharide transporter
MAIEPEEADAARLRRAEIGGGGLRKRVAKGTIVNTVYLLAINLVGALQGLLLARMLGAGEFGLWGLLAISFGTLLALAAIGLNDKYIQQDHPDQQAAFELAFTLQSMLVGLFTVIALIALPLFSLLYGEERILVPGLLLAAAMPLIALRTPTWVFYRRMDFAKQRLLEAIQPVTTLVITVTLALLGYGFWSLVLGTLGGAIVAAAASVYYSPYKLRFRYERGALKEYTSFSWPLFVSSISLVLAFQIPITFAESAIGPAAVGAIALASHITNYTRRVDDIVTHALYPAICAVKDKRELLYESFSKSNRLAILWGFPVGVAAALFAPQAVPFVLGDHWEFAVPLMQILALSAAVDQVGFNWTAFARARAETKVLALSSLVMLVAMVAVGVPALDALGLPGFAIGIGAATVATLGVRIVYLVRLFPSLDMTRHVLRSIAPTLAATAVILAERAVVGLGYGLPHVLAEIAAFTLIVAAATWSNERALLRESLGYVFQRARTTDAQTEPATRLA